MSNANEKKGLFLLIFVRHLKQRQKKTVAIFGTCQGGTVDPPYISGGGEGQDHPPPYHLRQNRRASLSSLGVAVGQPIMPHVAGTCLTAGRDGGTCTGRTAEEGETPETRRVRVTSWIMMFAELVAIPCGRFCQKGKMASYHARNTQPSMRRQKKLACSLENTPTYDPPPPKRRSNPHEPPKDRPESPSKG